FDRSEQARIEVGNPLNNLILTGNYTLGSLGVTLRGQRFGQVTFFGTAPTNAFGSLDQTLSPKWVTDLSASYALSRYSLAIGADNLFDIYPDRADNKGNIVPTAENGGTANFGIFPYQGISPFGFNGRFVYAKLTIGL
ncbi:MAG: hypothetical protein ABIP93_08455, partial [Gemmatimonadaceae bacterium]